MNDIQQPKRTTEADVSSSDTSAFAVSKISSVLFWIKNFFDYLGGSAEEPPAGASFLASPMWLGIWWGLMIGLILLFCGQTSKFIYIDF